jgi:hypothetical protein
MDEKNKRKLEHILKIGKNIPKALIEGSLFACTWGGPVVAIIGTPIAYFSGNPKLAEILGLGGLCATGAGLIFGGIYGILNSHGGEFGSLEEGDYAIDNIINEIKEYRNLVRN